MTDAEKMWNDAVSIASKIHEGLEHTKNCPHACGHDVCPHCLIRKLMTENARLRNRMLRIHDALYGKPWEDDDNTAMEDPR